MLIFLFLLEKVQSINDYAYFIRLTDPWDDLFLETALGNYSLVNKGWGHFLRVKGFEGLCWG